MNKFNFIESIKVVRDKEKDLLLNIQNEIEKKVVQPTLFLG